MNYSLGIDIGGTNTNIGLTTEEGNVVAVETFKTKAFDKVEDYLDEITKRVVILCKKVEPKDTILGVGIGAPNGNYYNGTIEHAPNLQFNGIIELKKELEPRLKQEGFDLKVTVTNDANAAAMGEMIYGKAKFVKDFLMITLGTGLGSGIVVGGKLVYGSTGFAGEVGHTIVEPNGRQCNCGRNGCLERYCSATGIVITAKEKLEECAACSLLREYDENELTSKAIYECALKGDKIALECFDYTARILARGIANAAEVTSPRKVYLFGGLANSGELLINPLRKYLEEELYTVYRNTIEIEQSGLKEADAAILGAAALTFE
ncbi:MAG: ROK family protein [Bacteroidales bacterium]|nr:ROK family protein [Bacteroidales bacterium]